MGSVDPLRITVDKELQPRLGTGRVDLRLRDPDGSGQAKTSSLSRSLASTTSTRLQRCRRRFVA